MGLDNGTQVVAHLKSHAQEHSDYLRLTTTGLGK